MSIDIPGLRKLWQEAFGDGESFLDSFFSTAYSPDRCAVITIDDTAAAALYWLDCHAGSKRYAYIYAVATAQRFRGRGLCRRLIAGTHDTLARQGYDGAILVPGEPELTQMYEKMGYVLFSGMDRFTCEAGEPVAVRKVSISEYGLLRREYLPEGGVLQEGQNLAFLGSYAALYAGSDFVLAAVEGDAFLGLELLGSAHAAPGILAALGYDGGTFRIPGSGPFAMYRPITNTPAPAYFGLAFD